MNVLSYFSTNPCERFRGFWSRRCPVEIRIWRSSGMASWSFIDFFFWTKYHCFWDQLYIFFSFLPQNQCFHSPHTTIVHQGSRLLMHSSLLLSGLLKILGYFYVSPNFIRLLQVVITPSVTLRGENDSKQSDEFQAISTSQVIVIRVVQSRLPVLI